VETVSTLRNDVHARNEARRNTRFGVGRKLVVSMAMGPSPPWPWLTAVRGPPGDDAPPPPLPPEPPIASTRAAPSSLQVNFLSFL
jgi:hypothetical protein